MKVIFSKYAKQELEDAASFYELEYPGLGEKFKEEVRRAILRIVDYPEAWSIESGEVRKYLLHKFPYKILYSIEQDYIFIITIAHGHRKPDYWIERNET
ncbi:plasmid stabilization protein [Peptococcaceae bacterium SCADC1_2_3]|nr:plasmid stabilization protein [Peptococcaceae bacterium SCADC1_2_3]KFI35450.1 plasmid stabilization protein [Peptococcaceae bacterium SCADC1_2_3]KFI36759.1 plasmid stabilization protein [Peptococcaceae bacterium SCADC1_2_3]